MSYLLFGILQESGIGLINNNGELYCLSRAKRASEDLVIRLNKRSHPLCYVGPAKQLLVEGLNESGGPLSRIENMEKGFKIEQVCNIIEAVCETYLRMLNPDLEKVNKKKAKAARSLLKDLLIIGNNAYKIRYYNNVNRNEFTLDNIVRESCQSLSQLEESCHKTLTCPACSSVHHLQQYKSSLQFRIAESYAMISVIIPSMQYIDMDPDDGNCIKNVTISVILDFSKHLSIANEEQPYIIPSPLLNLNKAYVEDLPKNAFGLSFLTTPAHILLSPPEYIRNISDPIEMAAELLRTAPIFLDAVYQKHDLKGIQNLCHDSRRLLEGGAS
ncbi:hypothetical protein COT48_03705 [Candidatus Woesearchaeota archaeon CG08_land_8_20_14_0_20_47_9]|nr:MAG: hypothetical protein AUJ69_00165 [Candidatus Woesearchaeota archaeon CG1_02_47_18]PIO03699.1 MAG: hypothetical protein COT48_03705 [Candidatus Woesearchaeota archaeon CG08_land_8_20_14_0_20_47_9]HII30299.1 hypothetical protein [Candidatus Woesearchaeota archaeon]